MKFKWDDIPDTLKLQDMETGDFVSFDGIDEMTEEGDELYPMNIKKGDQDLTMLFEKKDLVKLRRLIERVLGEDTI